MEPINNLRIERDGDNITRVLLNGNFYKVCNNTFYDQNNQLYIIFDNMLSLRKHTSVTNYTDSIYNIPSVIPYNKVEMILKWFANLSKHFVEVTGFEDFTKVPFKNTMDEIKNYLGDIFKLKLIANPVLMERPDLVETLYSYLSTLFENMDEDVIVKSLNTTDSLIIRLGNKNLKNGIESVQCTLQDTINYIMSYINLQDSTIEYVSCSYTPYVIFYMFYMLLIEESVFEEDIEKTKSELFINSVISLFVDITTDRLTTELFIKERNSTIKRLKCMYYRELPFLRRYHNKYDINETDIKSIFEKSMESVSDIIMFPYMLVWNFTEKCRIQFIYDHYRNIINMHYKNVGTNIDTKSKEIISKLPNADEFWRILQHITNNVDNSRYDMEILSKELIRLL